jgi:MFS family permease
MKNRKPGDTPPVPVEDLAPGETEGHAKARLKVPKRLFAPALTGGLALTVAGGAGDGLFISIWAIWLNDLHASNSFIGLTFITFSLPLMLLMPITGKWADKYRLAPLIAIPGVLISFVYFTYGMTSNLLLIGSLGLVEGTFIAIMGPAVSAYIANLSPDNARGRLQGVVSTVRTLAGFTSSMVVSILYTGGAFYPFMMLAAVQIVISLTAGTLVWSIESRTHRQAAIAAKIEAQAQA